MRTKKEKGRWWTVEGVAPVTVHIDVFAESAEEAERLADAAPSLEWETDEVDGEVIVTAASASPKRV